MLGLALLLLVYDPRLEEFVPQVLHGVRAVRVAVGLLRCKVAAHGAESVRMHNTIYLVSPLNFARLFVADRFQRRLFNCLGRSISIRLFGLVFGRQLTTLFHLGRRIDHRTSLAWARRLRSTQADDVGG